MSFAKNVRARWRYFLLAVPMWIGWFPGDCSAATITAATLFPAPQQSTTIETTASLTVTLSGAGTLFGQAFTVSPSPQTHTVHLDPEVVATTNSPVGTVFYEIDSDTEEVSTLAFLTINPMYEQTIHLQSEIAKLTFDVESDGGIVPITIPAIFSATIQEAVVRTTPGTSPVIGNAFTAPAEAEWLFDLEISALGGLLTAPIVEDYEVMAATEINGTFALSDGANGTATLDTSHDHSFSIVDGGAISVASGDDLTFDGEVEVSLDFRQVYETHLVGDVIALPEPGTWTLAFTALALWPLRNRLRARRTTKAAVQGRSV